MEWAFDEWRLRFAKQDSPSALASMFGCEGRGVIIEHTAQGTTDAREVTVDGTEPRRTRGPARSLRRALELDGRILVHLDGAVCVLDPRTLAFSEPIQHDSLATEIAIGTGEGRCYVGARGMGRRTWVIQLDRGIVQELPVAPPAFVLARPDHPREELWASAGDASWRRAVLDESGRVVELTPLEDGTERFVSFQRVGDAMLAATADQTKDPVPFAYSSSAIRDHSRLEVTSSGVRIAARRKSSTIYAMLGTTASGEIVTLDGKGKTSVALIDPGTLKTRASHAFRQHGSYELSMLVGKSTVLALRRYENLDRVVSMRWDGAPPITPRIADAKVTPIAGRGAARDE